MVAKQLFACAVALLVFGWVNTSGVLAQETDWLGKYATGVDVWKLVCPSGTTKVEVNIYDYGDLSGEGKDGVILTVLLLNASTGKTALRNAADAGGSAIAVVTGGPGTYYAMIHKNMATTDNDYYSAVLACRSSTGLYLNASSLNLVQNL
jgi:hypothetical protein